MRHEIQSSGDKKGLAGWPTGCLICRRRGLLNYHACIGELVLGFVRWHAAIFLFRRLAALDVSLDDYSSTLVAVGSQGSGPKGMMSPHIAMIALVPRWIFCRDAAHILLRNGNGVFTFQMPSIFCPKL